MTNERPSIEGLDYLLRYLDELRESGETNMFGAVSFLMEEFPDLSKSEAKAVLAY